MFYPYILIFIKPTAYVVAAIAAKKPLLETFLIFIIVATVPNFLIYYFPDFVKKLKKRVQPKKENGLRRRTRVVIWKWSKRFRLIPLVLFFFGPLLPIPFFEQICLVIGKILKIPFWIFAVIPTIQFFLIYFLGSKIF